MCSGHFNNVKIEERVRAKRKHRIARQFETEIRKSISFSTRLFRETPLPKLIASESVIFVNEKAKNSSTAQK